MIELREINPDNQAEIRSLAVRPDQDHLVAPVDQSLADAYVWSDAMFRAAYHQDKPVGYVVIFPFDEDGQRIVNIVRLMIDASFQRQGLGRSLLTRTMDWIRSLEPAATRIRIGVLPENEPALALYLSEGFREHGLEKEEIALYRDP